MSRYYKIIYCSYFIILLTLTFGTVLISNINTTTINIPHKLANITRSISIQGWGFFTRNPRENLVDIFAFGNNNIINITSPNFSVNNYFGLSRKIRKIGFETSLILENIQQNNLKWKKIMHDGKINYNKLPINNIKLPYSLATISYGEYILTKRTTTPWAWFNKTNNFTPYEVIRICLK